jgi:hypothetical protein
MDDGSWIILYELTFFDTAGAMVAGAGGLVVLIALALAPVVLFGRKPRYAYWDFKQVKATFGYLLFSLAIGAFGTFIMFGWLRATFTTAETYDGTAWTKHTSWSKRTYHYVDAGGRSCEVGRRAYNTLEAGQRIRLVRRAYRTLSLAVWTPPGSSPVVLDTSPDREADLDAD